MKMPRKVHRCGNCIMWSHPPSWVEEVGVCEIGYCRPLQNFNGNGVDHDNGEYRTTADSWCDHQAPIPEPGPPCPKCGAPTLDGFGLAGGGYGPYTYCENDGCDYFDKTDMGPDNE